MVIFGRFLVTFSHVRPIFGYVMPIFGISLKNPFLISLDPIQFYFASSFDPF